MTFIDQWLRSDIRNINAYHVPSAKNMLKMDAMESPFGVPEELKDEFLEYISRSEVNRYPDASAEELQATLRNLMGIPKDFGVLLGNGSDELIQLLSLACSSGDLIMSFEPSFVMYELVSKFAQLNYHGIPLDENFDINLNATLLAIKTKKPKLIFIAYPNNPTGSFVEKSDIDVLAEGLKKHPHVTILSDEIYSRQIFDDKEMPTFFNYPELRERLIVLEGWSKAYSMTGWRLGWSFWPKEMVPHVNKLLINSVSCVNAAAQFAGIAALDGPDDSINEMMVKFTERRKLIHEGLNSLPGIECSLPGGAFYAFPKVIGTGMNGSEFAKKCMYEAGVAIVPGTAFGKTCQDYVRFSFAASQDNISNALENIKKMLG